MTASSNVQIKKNAEKELRKIAKADLRRIMKRISLLALDPRPAGCERLFGDEGYRIRQGDYRILYAVEDIQRTVEIYKVGHRREVYR